jgi:hypothetical protein
MKRNCIRTGQPSSVTNLYQNVEARKLPFMFQSYRTILRDLCTKSRLLICTFKIISKVDYLYVHLKLYLKVLKLYYKQFCNKQEVEMTVGEWLQMKEPHFYRDRS